MATWAETLRELRDEYHREAGDRLDAITGMIAHLERTAGPAELRELMRRFHGLSGSGHTYGFPAVSALGRRGEAVCREVIESGGAPGLPDFVEWHEVVLGLRREFDQGGEPPEGTDRGDAHGAARAADVLVVDDDEAILATLRSQLAREGFTVRTATSRHETLRALEERMPDGLVADVLLPDGSGYSLVERLRALPGGDRVATLMISVRTGLVDHVEAIHCGADGYFEKPLAWEPLIRRLTYLLNRQRGEAPRVLAVEDDEQQAAYLEALLAAAGNDVRVCSDPRRFQTALVTFNPDLVLMDVVLPGRLRGHDLVRYLRSSERYATLPIVFLTSEGSLEGRIDGQAAGGDDYLVKPVPNNLLLQTVAARVERARFLRSLLERDGLTRLLNHSAFHERAKSAVARQRRQPGRAAWVMIDLDQFKDVNDRFGHPAGDRVLGALAALLRRRLRQSDVVGRYGADEFAVLIEDLSEAEAVRLMERLRTEFESVAHAGPDGSSFRTGFSAGVAMLEDVPWTVEAWKRAAHEALHAAKAQGRSRVVPYSLVADQGSEGERTH